MVVHACLQHACLAVTEQSLADMFNAIMAALTALSSVASEIFLFGLKARFTEALMRDKAKLDFPADRIFSTAETGQPKSDVLKQLEHKHPGTSYHFVEDKLGTLDKVRSNASNTFASSVTQSVFLPVS